jgi:hypothetical protein
MTIILIASALIATGAWLRWAIRPVVFAYEVGRETERLVAARRNARRIRGRQQAA